MLKMNVDNENIEPVTDLGLALGYSGQCIQRRLNSDSGAGANAGSRADMKFVTSDPLSELVWSSRNGLSLKCADSSFVDKKSSFILGAGPSNVVLSPSQKISAGRSSNDKPVSEENFIMSQDAFDLINETASGNILGCTTGIDVAVMSHSGAGHEDKTGEDKLS